MIEQLNKAINEAVAQGVQKNLEDFYSQPDDSDEEEWDDDEWDEEDIRAMKCLGIYPRGKDLLDDDEE